MDSSETSGNSESESNPDLVDNARKTKNQSFGQTEIVVTPSPNEEVETNSDYFSYSKNQAHTETNTLNSNASSLHQSESIRIFPNFSHASSFKPPVENSKLKSNFHTNNENRRTSIQSLGKVEGSNSSIANISHRMFARQSESQSNSMNFFSSRIGRSRMYTASISTGSLQSQNEFPSRGLVTLDASTLEILTANRDLHSLLEYDDSSLIGTPLLNFIQDGPCKTRFQEHLQSFKQKDFPTNFVNLLDGIILEFSTKLGKKKKLFTWAKLFQKGKIMPEGKRTIILIVEEIEELGGKFQIDIETGLIIGADESVAKLFNFSGDNKIRPLSSYIKSYESILENIKTSETDCLNQGIFTTTMTSHVIPVTVRVVNVNKTEGKATLSLTCLLNISGLLIIGNECTIQSGNETFLRHIFGYSMDELIGAPESLLFKDFKTQPFDASDPSVNGTSTVELSNPESEITSVNSSANHLNSNSSRRTLSKKQTANSNKNFTAPTVVEVIALHASGGEFKVSVQIMSTTESASLLWISFSEGFIKNIKAQCGNDSSNSDIKASYSPSVSNPALNDLKFKVKESKINEKVLQLRILDDPESLHEIFEIEREIGKGAYGTVQLATEKNGNQVSLKFVCKSKLIKVFRDERFDDLPKEIIALHLCSHENVIKFLQAYESPLDMIIVMEYFTNSIDLFQFIDEHPQMPENVAVKIFRQIASALQYCHGMKIAHRDIKEENILVNPNLEIKLIDFGSATLLTGPDGLNEEFKVFFGTLEYSSPEVLSGKPYKGLQNDVWALGITLYSIIYAENAFMDIEETLNGFLNPPFEASPGLQDLLAGMLEIDPEKRLSIDQVLGHEWLASTNAFLR